MANIFEKTQYSISDPQGSGAVSGFTPTPSTQDPLAAAIKGIETLGKTGKQIYTDIQVDKATEEFKTGVKDFIAAEEAEHVVGLSQQIPMLEEQTAEFMEGDETASAEEIALLTDMRSRLKKWDTAFKQKRISSTEFKIKMESTLKKYINMNPGIASELRRAATGTLGFDPSGAELDSIFAQQRASVKTSDDIQKATVDVMKKYGLLNPNLSVEQNVSLYGQSALRLQNSTAMIDFQYNAANKGNMLSKELQGQLSSEQVGSDIANSKAVIDQILNSDASSVDKQTALQQLLSSTKASYRQKYNLLDAPEIDAKLKPLSELIAHSIDVASGKPSKEYYDNIYQANVNQVLAGYSGTEKGARALATLKMAKGIVSVPPSVQVLITQALRDTAGVHKLTNDALGTNGKTSPFSSFDDLKNGGNEAMSKWFKQTAEAITQGADPKNPEHVKQFQNVIEGIMVPMFSDPDQVQAIEYDTLLKMAGNPKFVDMLKALPNADRVKSKLAKVSTAYTTALLQKFGHEVFEKYDPTETSPERFSLREEVFGIEGERLVEVNIDTTTGEFFFSPRQGFKGDKSKIAEDISRSYNKKYASRLNDAVKLTAHLKGHTNYKGMLDQYMERAPELLFFIRKAKELM